MIKRFKIKLDGKVNYIKVNIVNDDGEVLYSLKFTRHSESILKFTNFELAKLTANYMLSKQKDLNFDFVIHIDKFNEYSIKETQKISDRVFQIIDVNLSVVLEIEERFDHIVERIQYLSIDDGANSRQDKTIGIPKSNKLFKDIEIAAQSLLQTNSVNSIYKIERHGYKEYTLHVKGSTAKIHIMANSKIMDINQERRSLDQKCIPYNKKVDKFLTAYIFVSMERMEFKYFNNSTKIEYILEEIKDYIADDPEYEILEYVPVNFAALVSVDKDIRAPKKEVIVNDDSKEN